MPRGGLAYGCTDGGCRALSRLLTVIADTHLGASPDPDWRELPRRLARPAPATRSKSFAGGVPKQALGARVNAPAT